MNSQAITLQLSTSTSAFERGVAAAISLLNQLGTTASQTGTQISNYATNLNTRLTAAYSAADARQRVFDAGLGRLGDSLQRVGGKLSTYLTAPLLAAGAAAFKTYTDIDALKRGLNIAMGSAKAGAIEFEKLKEVAKLPGLGLSEAAQGSVQLQAVGFSADKARAILLQFGNALAMSGKGKAELNTVITQLGQLSGKGKVLSEDLKPIINAAPSIVPVLRRVFNSVNPEEISAKLKAAGKDSTYFVDILVSELAKLKRVSGGPKNAIENLGDSLKLSAYNFGLAADNALGLTDKLNGLGNFISELANKFGKLGPGVQTAILSLTGAAAAIGPISLGIGYLISILPTLSKAFSAGFGAITGPVGLAVAAIAAGAYIIISNWDAIKKVLVDSGVWDTVSQVVTTTVNVVGGAFASGVAFIKSIWDKFGSDIVSVGRAGFDTVATLVRTYMSVVGAEINAGVAIFRGFWSVFGEDITNIATGAFTALKGIVSGAFSVIATVFHTVAGVLTGIFKSITGVLTGDWSTLREGLQNITVSLWNGVLGLFVAGVKTAGGLLAGFLQTFGADTLAAKVQTQVTSITSNVNGLKLALEQTKSAANGAGQAIAKIPTKKATTTLDKPAAAPTIDFNNLGGDSYIKQLKDRQKALAEQIQSGRAKNQNVDALQRQYDALTKQIDQATESTKKHRAATSQMPEVKGLAVAENILARLTAQQQALTNAGNIVPKGLTNQIGIFENEVLRLKGTVERRTEIIIPVRFKRDTGDGVDGSQFIRKDETFAQQTKQRLTPVQDDFYEASKGLAKLPAGLSTVVADIKVQAKFDLDVQTKAFDDLKNEIAGKFKVAKDSPEFEGVFAKIIQKATDGTPAAIAKALEPFDTLKDRISGALQGAAQSAFVGMGELVGGLFSGSTTLASLPAMFGNILVTLAKTIGEAMIKFGLAGEAFQDLALDPVLSVVAGVALVALSSALGSTISSATKGGGSGGQKFARGGVFDQPTFGLFGEYAGAAHNKEIATPQKLMADTFRGELQKNAYRQSVPSPQAGGGSQRVEVVVSGSLKGEDIHFAQLRYAERYGNLTGG